MRYDVQPDSEAKIRAMMLGQVVQLLRESKGLKQIDLADAIRTNQATISRIEKGTLEPTGQLRLDLANALGLRSSDLERIVDDAETLLRKQVGSRTKTANKEWWRVFLKGIAVAGLVGLVVYVVARVLTEKGLIEPGAK